VDPYLEVWLVSSRCVLRCGQDDRLEFNTQTSSQWDGLRHWGFDDGQFYNGLTQEEILGKKTDRLGIHGTLPQMPPRSSLRRG
jgi:hypothetical protein